MSGFIGNALARELLSRGVDVYGLSSRPFCVGDIRNDPHFHFIHADFQDYAHLAELIPCGNYDAFFHFAWAGMTSGRNDYLLQISNISPSYEAAAAAKKLACRRFVFANSSHEFLKERTKEAGKGNSSVYGAAKSAAKQMCQAALYGSQTKFIGVLFTNIFGIGDRSTRSTNTLIHKLLSGEHLDLTTGDELYDWTYIDDCVNGIIAAAELGESGQVYYVGSRQLRPFKEIITEVRDIISPQTELRFGAYYDNSYVDFSKIDIYALYRDTGYLPSCNFCESIIKTAEWVKSLGWEVL